MPHSYGLRARTRHLFARDFRQHGPIKLSTYMKTYKVGDIVDIKCNAAVHGGMPHKFYHGYLSSFSYTIPIYIYIIYTLYIYIYIYDC